MGPPGFAHAGHSERRGWREEFTQSLARYGFFVAALLRMTGSGVALALT